MPVSQELQETPASARPLFEARDILVRGPNWLGDLVMSTPGFRALRAAYPAARITLHVRASLAPLLAGSPFFDRVVPLVSHHAGPAAMWREGRALRGDEGFDLGLCVPDSFSSAILMRLAGVRCIVGYRRGGRAALLHHAVTPPPEWARDRMVARESFVLGLTEAIGCESLGTTLELHTTGCDEIAVDSVLSELGIAAEGERLVALAPGAAFGPSKLWPVASFARVGDALARKGARVLLLGAPDEAPLSAAVAGAMQEPVTDVTGRLGLGGVKALVRRLSLLLCNDSGARHIAVAFGVPSLVFMGPTSLEKTNLNLERVHVFETDVDCRPCYLRECPIDHRCMTRIAPDDVARVALRSLESPEERP